MKTIGILGGMSWESSALYYEIINEEVKKRLGGLHSARCVMLSVDFQEIEKLQHRGDWDATGELLAADARRIEAAGADLLLIATNTMHKVAPRIEEALSIPLLHIADATAKAIRDRGTRTIGLLGTRFTMEEEFYAGRLRQKWGLEVLTPQKRDREIVHRIIYEELVLGIVREESRAEFLRIINKLADRGAEGIIEGCTEIGMLVKTEHTGIPLFDTTHIHAQKAVDLALRDLT
ncbi:aspartate/glutamate racemase family protein [Nitratifractor salsuginis]|uniref:Aspartate racemase n=1 Tax=Nitratifractor salsuginis (strain DSM 16511 / JCM 12458 / E9I37-1) TaxID=749222 RepID=E6WZ72_NITSE|nr:aspartate/glutamate racemase family protein [Nitratifractor salsuginis]ADV46584.1 aspartate racemase [Nitratifractor salsuginis DSM 16511]